MIGITTRQDAAQSELVRTREIESLATQARILQQLSDEGRPRQNEFLTRRNYLVSELLRHRQELRRVHPHLSLAARQAFRLVPPELTRDQARQLALVRDRAEEYLGRDRKIGSVRRCSSHS